MNTELVKKLKKVDDLTASKIRRLYFIKDSTKDELVNQFNIDSETLSVLLLKHSLIADVISDMYYREQVRVSLKSKSKRIKSINELIKHGNK